MTKWCQHDEDELINKYLGHIQKGTYIDVGCGDPDELSNTYELYEKGWRGLTVDPYELFSQRQRALRPEDKHWHGAISNFDGEIKMCDTGTIGSFIGNTYVKVGTPTGARHPVRIEPCLTMNSLLTVYPEFYNADLFSLDVETNEDKVLEKCDFTKFTPKLMIIEYIVRNKDYRKNWEHFILSFYNEVHKNVGNVFYVRKK